MPFNKTVTKNYHPITRWTPLHSDVLLRYTEGQSPAAISNDLKVSITIIEKIVKSQMFVKRSQEVQGMSMDKVVRDVVSRRSDVLDGQAAQEARRILTEASISAALAMVQMSKDPDAKSRVQLEACKDILDRAGLRPIVITETRERVYSPEEIAGAKAVLEETQAIIERLANKTSPFVLGDSSQGQLASSDTDQAQ